MSNSLLTPPATPAVYPQSEHLEIPTLEFEKKFSREPFLIKHKLCDHPLFDIERILELAQTLPADNIEYNAGEIPISVDHANTPQTGLSAEETIRRIRDCKSWLVLKYVEQDPEYAQLLNECMEQLRPFTEPIAPGMVSPEAFVFVTSPGSVTPYHIDPEHNFLLQVRGSKEVHMYDGRNRELLKECELEDFYSDRGRNLEYKPEYEEHAWVYDLQPGQGLHFPVTYPHYVKNGEEVSISFSITFRTPDLDRRRGLYQFNGKLRDWGMTPKAVGHSRLRDSSSFFLFRLLRKMKLVR